VKEVNLLRDTLALDNKIFWTTFAK